MRRRHFFTRISIISIFIFNIPLVFGLNCITPNGDLFCLNGGNCTIQPKDFFCTCLPNYFGSRCQKKKCPAFNPCQNNSLCEKTSTSFICHCNLGYEGRYCENKVSTACDEQPCVNGTCRLVNSISQYQCDCFYGFAGKNCSVIDKCINNDCLYGDCQITETGHQCNCMSGWEGEKCDKDVNECSFNDCNNNGNCINTSGSYFCNCTTGFGGKNCEIEHHNSCQKNPCLNGGKCVDDIDAEIKNIFNNNSSNYNFTGWFFNFIEALHPKTFSNNSQTTCACLDGYFGEFCEMQFDSCAMLQFELGVSTINDVCLNGGKCISNGFIRDIDVFKAAHKNGITAQCLDAKCKCPSGFTGDLCEMDVDECAISGICENNGHCVNKIGSFQCICDEKLFNGDRCQFPIDDCVENICYQGSKCVDRLGYYECECTEDRMGFFCEDEKPCYKNRNKCVHGSCLLDFTCKCDDGFKGINCDIDINECEQSPSICPYGNCTNTFGSFMCDFVQTCEFCQNDAKCIQNLNKIECDCPTGFFGNYCEIYRPNPCDLFDCDSSSICKPTENYLSFTCDPLILENGDFCSNIKCQNNGICIPLLERFECICKDGFSGILCQNKLPKKNFKTKAIECSNCQNNSTCRKKNLNEKISNYCDCLPGFTGKYCNLKINTCFSEPCQNNGRCINTVNNFYCDCEPGFTGQKCETNINDCENINCLNNGTCIDEINSFSCNCMNGFMGRYCEIKINQFDRTDALERELCKRHNCAAKAHNEKCNIECNYYACEFDGGDCTLDVRKPFEKCAERKSYCAHVFADGKCDEICNVEDCLFDAFDCQNTKSTLTIQPANKVNNTNPSNLNGELSLILMVKEIDFFKNIYSFLHKMSQYLHASIHISFDSNNQLKIYRWHNITGAEFKPINPPKDFNIKHSNVIFEGEKEFKPDFLMPSGFDSSLVSNNQADGIKVFFQIDVQFCRVMQLKLNKNIFCFSEIESVAAYLGVSSAKNVIDDICFKINAAEAIVYKPQNNEASNYFSAILASAFILIVCIIIVVQITNRKRKFVCAPIFRPLLLTHNKLESLKYLIGPLNAYYSYSPQAQLYDCKENGININNLNNGSYSSSSGVSSGQSSPLYSLISNEFEQKNLINLHDQTPMESVDSTFIGLKNLRGKTSLMHLFDNSRIVSQHNNIEQFKLNIDSLISAGADINAQDHEGKTALIMAIIMGCPEIVSHLINQKANVNLADFENQFPIHFAITALVPETLTILLASKGINIEAANNCDETPLILCAKMVHCAEAIDFAKQLIDAGASLDSLSSKNNMLQTALHVSAKVGNIIFIRFLIERGANREATDFEKRTALAIAALNGHLNASELLVKLGANVDSSDLNEKTMLQYAYESNNEQVISYFTELEKKKSLNFSNNKETSVANLSNNKNQKSITSTSIKSIDNNLKKQKISTFTKNKSNTDNSLKPAKRLKVTTNLDSNEKNTYNLKNGIQNSYASAVSNCFALPSTNLNQPSYSTSPSKNLIYNNSFANIPGTNQFNQNYLNNEFLMQSSQQYFTQNSSFISESLDVNYDYITNTNIQPDLSNSLIMLSKSNCEKKSSNIDLKFFTSEHSDLSNKNSSNIMFLPEFMIGQTQNLTDANKKFTSENSSSSALESICTVSSLLNTASLPTQTLTNDYFSTDIKANAQNYLNYNLYQFQNVEKNTNSTPSSDVNYPKKMQYSHPQNNVVYNHVVTNQYPEY